MAQMIPRTIPPDIYASERKVWRSLEQLGDEWVVMHSVAWQSERNGRPGDGEADFVLMCPDGLLVLEVKGGEIERTADGFWERRTERGVERIRDPFEQAVSSKHALRRYLSGFAGCPRYTIGHAVVFPDGRVTAAMGPEGPRAIIVDRTDLESIRLAAGRLLDHWEAASGLRRSDIETFALRLAPTTQVRRLLSDVVAEVNQDLIQLTDQQARVVGGLRRNRRALVSGGAGTGKTVLATERARQLGADGFDVLLLCFNELLGKVLEAELADRPNVQARRFHSFCLSLLQRGAAPRSESGPCAVQLVGSGTARRGEQSRECSWRRLRCDRRRRGTGLCTTLVSDAGGAPARSDQRHLLRVRGLPSTDPSNRLATTASW